MKSEGPHPSDISSSEYELHNHKKGEVKKYKFQMNPTLLKSKLTLVNQTELPKEIEKNHKFSHAHYTAVM